MGHPVQPEFLKRGFSIFNFVHPSQTPFVQEYLFTKMFYFCKVQSKYIFYSPLIMVVLSFKLMFYGFYDLMNKTRS